MADSMDRERYLARIGVDPAGLHRDVGTLARLQGANVTTVPFETLSITGDPYGAYDGEAVSLALPDLYEKIVGRGRGGFCYELNGLFAWLLSAVGFDVDRASARIRSDGEFGPPADHLTLLVSCGRRYLVDVGLGSPKPREPLELDGTATEDEAGVAWRVLESERPDADYALQYSTPDDAAWATRYVLRDVPREMRYFEATCEYFQSAPESPFTGDPVAILATDRGHVKLSPTALTRNVRGESERTRVGEAEWYDLLEGEFGIDLYRA